MSSRHHHTRHPRKRRRLQLGFSLIEVLIFLTILSLVFITAAAVASISIQNSKSAEHRILAARYGQELMDWLHGQKEAGWDGFIAYAPPNTSTTYCFNDTEPVSGWGVLQPGNGICTGLIDKVFDRELTLTYNPLANQVTVFVNVKWEEGGNKLNAPIKSVFAPFE